MKPFLSTVVLGTSLVLGSACKVSPDATTKSDSGSSRMAAGKVRILVDNRCNEACLAEQQKLQGQSSDGFGLNGKWGSGRSSTWDSVDEDKMKNWYQRNQRYLNGVSFNNTGVTTDDIVATLKKEFAAAADVDSSTLKMRVSGNDVAMVFLYENGPSISFIPDDGTIR